MRTRSRGALTRPPGAAQGVALLRRDGFASVAPAAGAPSGRLTTRPLAFNGSRLFVNVVLPAGGSLRVEVLSAAGSTAEEEAPLPRGGTAAGTAAPPSLCDVRPLPLHGPLDATRAEVRSHTGFGAAARRRVRLRFTLSAGSRLFAFWLTDSMEGKSGGYLGGGQYGRSSRVDR